MSRRIVTELLREKLGFCGVIITDAMLMGGITTRGSRKEIVLGVLDAGCDMILFAQARFKPKVEVRLI